MAKELEIIGMARGEGKEALNRFGLIGQSPLDGLHNQADSFFPIQVLDLLLHAGHWQRGELLAFLGEDEAQPGVLVGQTEQVTPNTVWPGNLLGFVEHQEEMPVAKSLTDPGQKMVAKNALGIGQELLLRWQLDLDVSVSKNLVDSRGYFPQKAFKAVAMELLEVHQDREVQLAQAMANLVEE